MLSNNTIFKRLRGKRILILGFGREGKSSLVFIQKFLPHAIVGIADKNESAFKDLNVNANLKIYFGENYFDAINDYDIVIKTPGISLLDKDVDLSKITSQTDLFLEAYHSQIIGITGTKGKSTTSTLIYQQCVGFRTDRFRAGLHSSGIVAGSNGLRGNPSSDYQRQRVDDLGNRFRHRGCG